jgi:hypothetical protein
LSFPVTTRRTVKLIDILRKIHSALPDPGGNCPIKSHEGNAQGKPGAETVRCDRPGSLEMLVLENVARFRRCPGVYHPGSNKVKQLATTTLGHLACVNPKKGGQRSAECHFPSYRNSQELLRNRNYEDESRGISVLEIRLAHKAMAGTTRLKLICQGINDCITIGPLSMPEVTS